MAMWKCKKVCNKHKFDVIWHIEMIDFHGCVNFWKLSSFLWLTFVTNMMQWWSNADEYLHKFKLRNSWNLVYLIYYFILV